MSASDTFAKQRYNATHYSQIKVSVSPELASAFKNACASNSVSMAAKISEFMAIYSNTYVQDKPAPDFSTRRKRRSALSSIVGLLEQVTAAEESYRDNIPLNLTGSIVYDSAEQSICCLDEAIDLLRSVY